MNFISLIDIPSKNVITVDADSLVLRLEIDGVAKETRLKKYHGEIHRGRRSTVSGRIPSPPRTEPCLQISRTRLLVLAFSE
jgi:hypothetical protein